MVNKEEAIKEISRIIQDFRENYKKYESLSEADIETKLVEEIFIKALGWEKSDFIKRERAQRGDKRGFADYAFKINDKTVFFLEVKKVGIALEKEADKQVISYALSKHVPFAVSTNFEEMKIFCVEGEKANDKIFRVFNKPEDYLNNISDLLFLSKESFQNDLLLKQAANEGRLKKRISINEILLEDLMHIRRLLALDIEKRYPNKYNINEQDEIIQRIIDRLIFIRRSEDVGIQPDDLRLYDITHLSDERAYSKLKDLFKQYDTAYNSGLFAIGTDNDCDIITLNGEIIKKLIYLLYDSKDKQYIYNFDWIDADVLGQVYEQYLGKILQQTKSGRAKLKDSQAHRKEQGIYYTPTYIVDYIIKNTVVELLKDKKTDASNIKILDPACGSGSFLIKAFDYLNEYMKGGEAVKQSRIDSQGAYSIKTDILKKNLLGVDLDQKAVEITKLSLLLKAAEKNRKLPEEVDMHIRHGNSLIDDESLAGLNAFKWEGDFQEGSFDIVIGNPPYGIVFDEKEKAFLENKFPSFKRNNDLYVAFIEKSINLLIEGGLFSFIVPNTYIVGSYFENLKEIILKKAKIVKIIDFGINPIFQDPNVFNSIIILQKEASDNKRLKNKIKFLTVPLLDEANISNFENYSIESEVIQSSFSSQSWKPKNKIIEKILKKKEKIIDEFCYVKDVGFNYWSEGRGKKRGDSIGSRVFYEGERKNQKDIPYLKGRDIVRYGYSFSNHWLKHNYNEFLNKKTDTFRFSQDFLGTSPKIIYRQTADRIIATMDYDRHYTDKTVHLIVPKEGIKINLLSLLGVLNSKLMLFVYRDMVGEKGRTFAQVKTIYIKNLPFIMNEVAENKISELVNIQLDKTKKLQEIGEKLTSDKTRLQEDLNKIDEQIDEEVYKLYGITKEEQKTIEESLK